MNARILVLLLFCIGIPDAFAGDELAQAAGANYTVNNTAVFSAIVAGLPWEYRHSSMVVDDEQVADSATRYDFVSTEAVNETAQSKVYMRADLTVTVYTTPEQSMEAWARIKAKANPDMGLSYAWDYLLLQGSSQYHLHAGCVVSEENFEIMVNNLRKVILQQNENPDVLRCRCGSGCNVTQ